jgi:small subunit ribosomal protein S30e
MATHGSLTKAGKVRGQTPKVEGRKIVGTNSREAEEKSSKRKKTQDNAGKESLLR